MRVGVLTYHKCFNYGAYWQASCLANAVRARGHDAVILNHESWRATLREWICGLNPVTPAFSPLQAYPGYARKISGFLRAGARLPLSRKFALQQASNLEDFDMVIVGSDEVWNLKHPWYGGCPLFFGKGIRAGRLVSYAASFGNYPASEGLSPEIAEALRRFETISVRDDNSRELIQGALGVKPEIVLDPCLQFEPEPDSDCQLPDRPYAVVYGHSFSLAFANRVKQWARETDLRLISVGYHNAWVDENRHSATPDDFVHLMRSARAVATNFFHGCVFALRYGHPFVCEAMAYRAIKIRDLLALVGAEPHQLESENDAEIALNRLSEPLSPAIFARIDRLRESSANYLNRVLAEGT